MRNRVHRVTERGQALGLTVPATFRLILELLVMEEQLFSRGEYKLGPTIHTLQYLVLKFHLEEAPMPQPLHPTGTGNSGSLCESRGCYSPSRTRPFHVLAQGMEPCNSNRRLKAWMSTALSSEKEPPPPAAPNFLLFYQSCSLRAFLRLRLRASASFTRFRSPGFR
jgi:hypothetical protein